MAAWLFGRVSQCALDFQILVEAELTPLPTVAAALVAAERRVQVERMVDRHPSGPDLAGNLASFLEVSARNIAGKAVFGVVCDLDGLVEIAVAEDAQHRPEDLLARNRHMVRAVREDGRLDVIPLAQPGRSARTAGDHGRALVDALLDQSLHLVELGLRRPRPDPRRIVATNLDLLGSLASDRNGLVHTRIRDQHA